MSLGEWLLPGPVSVTHFRALYLKGIGSRPLLLLDPWPCPVGDCGLRLAGPHPAPMEVAVSWHREQILSPATQPCLLLFCVLVILVLPRAAWPPLSSAEARLSPLHCW